MTRPRTFYVYEHRRPGEELPFYIGKGSWTPKKAYGRAASDENRNVIWRRTVAKAGGFASAVAAEFFAEADAFAFEAELIALHGRRDRGGRLVNLTDGGEGGVGRVVKPEALEKRKATMMARGGYPKGRPSAMLGKKHTAEAKAAISAGVAGAKNPMHGKTHSAEARAKMAERVSANHARAKPVIDTSTGIKYRSAREAARQLGISQSHLKNWLLTGRNPSTIQRCE